MYLPKSDHQWNASYHKEDYRLLKFVESYWLERTVLACSIEYFSFRGPLGSSILCAPGEPFWIQKSCGIIETYFAMGTMWLACRSVTHFSYPSITELCNYVCFNFVWDCTAKNKLKKTVNMSGLVSWCTTKPSRSRKTPVAYPAPLHDCLH